jgi:hypothetical protein
MPQAFGTGFTSSHRKHKLQGQVLIIIHHCLRYLSFIVMLLPSQTANFRKKKKKTKEAMYKKHQSSLYLHPAVFRNPVRAYPCGRLQSTEPFIQARAEVKAKIQKLPSTPLKCDNERVSNAKNNQCRIINAVVIDVRLRALPRTGATRSWLPDIGGIGLRRQDV